MIILTSNFSFAVKGATVILDLSKKVGEKSYKKNFTYELDSKNDDEMLIQKKKEMIY